MEVYRQGDVVIRKLAETDADDVQEHQSILARGEVTGHAHRLTGGEWRCNGETLVVITYALLEHEEHSTIRLPPGVYEIFRQRELDPFTEIDHWEAIKWAPENPRPNSGYRHGWRLGFGWAIGYIKRRGTLKSTFASACTRAVMLVPSSSRGAMPRAIHKAPSKIYVT